MFGVALLPFSWPFLAAVPILLGTAVALSQGGVGPGLVGGGFPRPGTAAWVVASFGVLSLSSALMARLDTPGRGGRGRGWPGLWTRGAWYGLTTARGQGGYGGAGSPSVSGGFRGVVPPGLALRHRTTWVPHGAAGRR